MLLSVSLHNSVSEVGLISANATNVIITSAYLIISILSMGIGP